jgi:mycofactocin system glycosyltransferase
LTKERRVDSEPGAAEDLARRLVSGGVLHPVPPRRVPSEGEIGVVVPVRDDAGRLGRLLHVLRRDFDGTIVVVDDGSSDGAASRIAGIAARPGAILCRRPVPGGPAAARNAGVSMLDTAPLVAFVDADVTVEPEWLDGLVGHFDDPEVGAVAPRVMARQGTGRIGRALGAYDSVRSPLDLGAEPALVGAHRRVSYVPAAVIVCRRTALDAIGGFDAAMRVGEDVDLVRRLESAGWVVRFEPGVRVRHDTRGGFSAFARQRFGYGTSAAELELRHPGTVAPFEGTWWGVVAAVAGLSFACAAVTAGRRGTLGKGWDTCVPHRPESRKAKAAGVPHRQAATTAGAALAWLVATAIPLASLRVKLMSAGVGEPTWNALALVTKGQLASAGGLASATRRVGWPPALVAVSLVPRLRCRVLRAMAVAELAGALTPWRTAHRQPDSDVAPGGVAATLAIGLLDDLSYGAGVWAGCLRRRSFRALLPRMAPKTRQSTAD